MIQENQTQNFQSVSTYLELNKNSELSVCPTKQEFWDFYNNTDFQLTHVLKVNVQTNLILLMRPSTTKSFRLQRISRVNSAHKVSESFDLNREELVKMSAVNSINRGVKYNDLSFIIGGAGSKLRKDELSFFDGFYESAHDNLTERRKKYDSVKKQKIDADSKIEKLKDELRKMKLKQQESSNNMILAEVESKRLQGLLEGSKFQVQQISMQKKVLLEMRKNLKADRVVYEQRKLTLERELNSAKKELSTLHKEGNNMVNEASKCGKIYQKLTKEISFQERQRDEHLRGLESLIEEKQRCNFDEIAREKILQEIAEKAFVRKQESEIEWSNVYLVNIMVNRMLRNKIDKEMEKFSVIEFAFKNIKSATGVSDSKTFVKKYLNKQSQYGNLLGRITVNENRINELKEERDSLVQEHRRIEYEKQTLDHIKIKDVEISNEINTLIALETQKKNIDIQCHKMHVWMGRESKKFLSLEKGLRIDHRIGTDQLSLKNSFIDICKNILQILGSTGKEQFQQLTEVSDLSGRDSARVTRIQQKKTMKSFEGKEILEGEEQETFLSAQTQQTEIVAAQRQQLLRANSKFMKQARKRLQQRKKAEIEKGDDNKKRRL